MFETNLIIKDSGNHVLIQGEQDDFDGLNFLSGKSLEQINKTAFDATTLAHYDGGVPNCTIQIDSNIEEELGNLIYFFEKSCAISGLILGVNPFNQPGVEAYKNNMFALLGKPGYENLRNGIYERLKSKNI